MKTISRYIMTLALLLTAVGGAWAQTQWTSGDCTVTLNNGTLTASGKGAMADYNIISNRPWHNNRNDITSVVVESGVTTVGKNAFYGFGNMTSVTLPEGLTSIGVNAFPNCSKLTSVTIPSTVTSIGTDAFYGCYSMTDVYLYADPANLTWNEGSNDDFKQGGYTKCHVLAEHLSAYQTKFTGKVNVTFVGDLKPLPGTVTLNDTKTEASFEMPTNDVYVSYELVRDMSVQMTAQVGDGTQEQPRYRVKKDGTNWIPADLQPTDIPGLFSVIDGIENNKVLTQTTDYIVKIYAIDEQGQPTGEPMTFTTFTFEPGIYAVKAVAADGSDYAGETALSNTFKLYDYINITFPKGYSTHYYNESLVLDEIRNSLKFYAVTAVTSEKVTLTEIEGKAIPGGTPFIVYNETAEPITAVMGMLQADDVTSAEQFKGTAEDKNMGSQSNCYILRNGDSTPTFRLVDGAGTLPAHRCYIDLGAVACTRSLGFDFGDGTTGIDSVESGELKVDSYYDLQGRKHQGTPQRKGVYVKDGRKVIVR